MTYTNTSPCDGCLKPVEAGKRYCPDCLKAIAERAAPKDCRFCDGKETVHATYHMESDYGDPYICHKCMKDQKDVYTWEHIPPNIVNMEGDEETDEQLRIINWQN